jgi:hypothetical protein
MIVIYEFVECQGRLQDQQSSRFRRLHFTGGMDTLCCRSRVEMEGALVVLPQAGRVMRLATDIFGVVDQFGYLPNLKKVAVLRNPVDGFDSADQYIPGATLQLVGAPLNLHPIRRHPSISS